MRYSILFGVGFLCILTLSCTKQRVKTVHQDYLNQEIELDQLSIEYPMEKTLFPIDFQSPTFRWTDLSDRNTTWYASVSDSLGSILLDATIEKQEWKPDSSAWEKLKINHVSKDLHLAIIGYHKRSKKYSGGFSHFRISKDSVGAEIFFRAVTLPFSYAVRNVHTIEWYLGNVSGGKPRKMLDNMPVCANCHSFSNEGPTLAMDVDYGNDKGSYALTQAVDTSTLRPENIISWSNFKKDEGEPTFGLLSQISPSGKHVLSTVKDLSVFAAVDDNLAYSQLFFPIKGIIGTYNVEENTFTELQGANDPQYVQSNPVWSPDNSTVLFARTQAYINEKVRKYGNALLNIDDVKEFRDGNKEFKFDIYAVDFNNGEGGIPRPLEGASNNSKSNYFPKYSPDGKWIVFCQAENFMLLQPDSKLYIMKADGSEARLMNCNTDNMNSWHSWSPNGHWMVFSSKEHSLYTRLYLTHIDDKGIDSPPILIENLVFEQRAANIPEFYPGDASKFLSIRDEFSNTASYYTRLATDNIKSQYYLRANQNIKHAISLDPNYIDAYILRILLNSFLQQMNSLSEKAEKNKALEVVEEQIMHDNDNLELKFLKASLLSASGEYQQSLELLNAILFEAPDFYRAYELKATVYKKINEPQMVIRTYRKMIDLIPVNKLEISISIARYYLSLERITEAQTLLKQLLVQYPEDEELHELLCSIYISNNDMQAAEKEIQYLIQNDSTNYNYYLMYSDIADISGDKDKAREYNSLGYKWLQQKWEKNEENIPLAFELANLRQKNQDFQGALGLYDHILNILPANYRALKEKARIRLMRQQWQEAIYLYEELLRTYTPEEEFYNNTAIAYVQLGNYEEALSSFSNILKLNPDNIDALFNRSKLYNMMGDPKRAAEDLNTMKQILRAKENLTEDERRLLKM